MKKRYILLLVMALFALASSASPSGFPDGDVRAEAESDTAFFRVYVVFRSKRYAGYSKSDKDSVYAMAFYCNERVYRHAVKDTVTMQNFKSFCNNLKSPRFRVVGRDSLEKARAIDSIVTRYASDLQKQMSYPKKLGVKHTYSTDGGATWQVHCNNPVFICEDRRPELLGTEVEFIRSKVQIEALEQK